MTIKKLELDWDTADGITKLNLKHSYEGILKDNKEIKKRIKDGETKGVHLQDLAYNEAMLIHMQEVLSYFGEKV